MQFHSQNTSNMHESDKQNQLNKALKEISQHPQDHISKQNNVPAQFDTILTQTCVAFDCSGRGRVWGSVASSRRRRVR